MDKNVTVEVKTRRESYRSRVRVIPTMKIESLAIAELEGFAAAWSNL